MKQLILILLLTLPLAGISAQSADSLEIKIGRLLELSGAKAQFLSAVDNIIAIQRQNVPAAALDEDFWDEFSREVRTTAYEDLRPLMVEIYRSNLNEKEIDHQIAYYSNPLTQQIVAKQGAIMQQSMAVGAEWGRQLGEKIMVRLREVRKG